MLGLALLMVPLVVLQESSNDVEVLGWTERLNAVIWVAFVAEYGYLLALSDNRRRFVRSHWFDLLIIVLTPPVLWLPSQLDALRALRALRIIRAFAVIGQLGANSIAAPRGDAAACHAYLTSVARA